MNGTCKSNKRATEGSKTHHSKAASRIISSGKFSAHEVDFRYISKFKVPKGLFHRKETVKTCFYQMFYFGEVEDKLLYPSDTKSSWLDREIMLFIGKPKGRSKMISNQIEQYLKYHW